MVRRDPDLFPDAYTRGSPDNTLDVQVIDPEENIAELSQEATTAELAILLDDLMSPETVSDSATGTDEFRVDLQTFGKPNLVLSYSVSGGDGTISILGSMSATESDADIIEEVDTTSETYENDDLLYFPWTPHEYITAVYTGDQADVALTLEANR